VTVVVPNAIPEAIPLAGPIVATDRSELVQLPLAGEPDSAIAPPTQSQDIPVIDPDVGPTVIVVVVRHPSLNV
jgi:hypothetical protein